MPRSTDIHDYVFHQGREIDLEPGDDVRVRPAPDLPRSYGQGGPAKGPSIGLNGQSISINWGQPLKVADGEGLGSPDKGTITLQAVELLPDVFMSESAYQDFLTATEQE